MRGVGDIYIDLTQKVAFTGDFAIKILILWHFLFGSVVIGGFIGYATREFSLLNFASTINNVVDVTIINTAQAG